MAQCNVEFAATKDATYVGCSYSVARGTQRKAAAGGAWSICAHALTQATRVWQQKPEPLATAVRSDF